LRRTAGAARPCRVSAPGPVTVAWRAPPGAARGAAGRPLTRRWRLAVRRIRLFGLRPASARGREPSGGRERVPAGPAPPGGSRACNGASAEPRRGLLGGGAPGRAPRRAGASRRGLPGGSGGSGGFGCWVLGAGCRVLGAGCWVLAVPGVGGPRLRQAPSPGRDRRVRTRAPRGGLGGPLGLDAWGGSGAPGGGLGRRVSVAGPRLGLACRVTGRLPGEGAGGALAGCVPPRRVSAPPPLQQASRSQPGAASARSRRGRRVDSDRPTLLRRRLVVFDNFSQQRT